MKKKLIIGAIVVVVAAGSLAAYSRFKKDEKGNGFETTELTRGRLEETVSSTGTLNPVTEVQVGTQVSGIVAEVYVDYNDLVEKNQILAVLDTSVLQEAVNEARAQLRSAQAQYQEALSDYNRSQPLFEQKYISESEFLPIQTKLKTSKASVQSARSAVERAERNLGYAYIRSPIDGIVISRNVEAGQTMAASFNAPVLFQIAEDLSKMEIVAEVDESDISQVRKDMKVRFTVQAYPDMTFEGKVDKIRLEPVTVSNVVNYMVVVSTNNDKKLLLPGMTAELDFIVAEKNDALLVKNSALQFHPPQEMLDAFVAQHKAKHGAHGKGEAPSVLAGGTASGPSRENLRFLWYQDKDGKLDRAPVEVGMSDGIRTEIVSSPVLKEGMEVITGIAQPGVKKKETVSLLPKPPKGGGRHRF